MANFMIRFLLCNIFISGIIGLLLLVKRIFKKNLSSRMQYNLWFLMLLLLAVPFVPLRPIGFPQIFSWFLRLGHSHAPNTVADIEGHSVMNPTGTANWMNDFALDLGSEAPSVAGLILLGIWIVGILAMIVLVIKSSLRIRTLKKSALPLQNREVHKLYKRCLKEMEIVKTIPIYSTAFFKSPLIVGFLKPCIYLPIHLISDYNESDMRYMLLHELQHYRHKDTVVSYLMNLAGVLYWFNPFVWYALKEMRSDREVACDTSVLKMLNEDAYEDYGNTLINFAEKVSLTPFPFVAGIGGSMKQMKRRILNIASYEKPSLQKRLKGIAAFMLTAVFLLGLAPILSTYAAGNEHYQWNLATQNISHVDYSAYFDGYEGSFVLYDLENDAWHIHNMEQATLRVAPNSTYKIYDALFGLEEDIITPENSLVAWNKERHPFEEWNADQDLSSAMLASVNWYFQSIDQQLGAANLNRYIQEIGYGNKNLSGDFSTYWLESSLKISPIEQALLLTKLHNNSFGFALENINAVKDAIRLSTSESGTFYGKTGTGRVDGQDISGWFIGLLETPEGTYFFATNIQGKQDATGSKASEISLAILSDLRIWK